MRRAAPLIIFLALGGCVAQPDAAAFSWYHPQGGEFLFEYDADQCQIEATARGQGASSDPTSPFFRCMYERGYVLVNADGTLTGPTVASVDATPALSQQ